MISKAKKILSSFILSSIILSSIGFSASASNSETPVLKEDSLYIVNDNYIEDVIAKTDLASFCSNFNSKISVYKPDGTLVKDDDIISTGCYFALDDNKYTVVVAGDVDGSGVVDSTDYLQIKSSFFNSIELTDSSFVASDIDSSGTIDSTDYIQVKSGFLGNHILPSSKEYFRRKSLSSSIINSMTALSQLKDYNASVDVNVLTENINFDIKGEFLATEVGSASPDFSFILNASTDGITYPLAETYYGSGILYNQNNGARYKVKSSFADVSLFLSKYLRTSPVNSEGNFILVPYVNSDKVLNKEFREISSIIKNISSVASNDNYVFSFETINILKTKLLTDALIETIGEESFGGLEILNLLESVCAKGNITADQNNVMYNLDLTLDIILTEEGMAALGSENYKNISVSIRINFKEIGEKVTVFLPDSSDYTEIDNIYTQFAFSAYNNVFDIALAISSTYKETLSFNSQSAYIESTTNGRNTTNGIELSKNSDITINDVSNYKKIFIGNGQYITDNNGSVSEITVETLYQTVSKMGSFFTPHYNSLSDITDVCNLNLIENEDTFTLNYELTKDYAISLVKNSDIIKLSTFESDFGVYGDDLISLKNSTAAITYDKNSFEVISNTVNIELVLNNSISFKYSYEFEVNSVDYNSVLMDYSLNN